MVASESARVVNSALVGNLLVTLTNVVAPLSVDFKDSLSALEVERIVAALEDRVRRDYPEVVSLLINPQKPERADFTASAGHDDGG